MKEIVFDMITGETLYSCRWTKDGDVFLSDGSSAEVWGTGGRTAASYAVEMTEDTPSGHYVGSFDPDGNISAGLYKVTVFSQAGANPANADQAIGLGEINWGGRGETTIGVLSAQKSQILNVYNQ